MSLATVPAAPVPLERSALPSYIDFVYPTLCAVATLGGSAQAREITAQVIVDTGATPEQLAVAYPNNPKSVLVDRMEWARSYAMMGGGLERPKRGLYVLTVAGREILAMSEEHAQERVRVLDREVRARQRSERPVPVDETQPAAMVEKDELAAAEQTWREVLLARLHKLTPEGFEEFTLYLLRAFGMVLTRVGGTGDEGIDGIGLAPISDVLSSRVAVQAKRYDPASVLGREVVALFQRDASAAGAERAVLVTLGRFSAAAQKAATAATPTVNLIDGEKLCDLVEQERIGIELVPTVMEKWFDRFV